MAAVVADSTDKKGRSPNSSLASSAQHPHVSGNQAAQPRVSPVKREDPRSSSSSRAASMRSKRCSHLYEEALKLADVCVDVQCDYLKESLGNVRTGSAEDGRPGSLNSDDPENIPPTALVLIETTVAPEPRTGCLPIMKKVFKNGAFIPSRCWRTVTSASCRQAHVASIRDFCASAAVSPNARKRVTGPQ